MRLEKAMKRLGRKEKMSVERVDVSPSPHYPNWRYLCLECMKFHEKYYRMLDFRMQCDDCQKIQIEKEIKAGTMTPEVEIWPLSYGWRNDV